VSDFPTHLAIIFADYQAWLTKQPLAKNTRRTYLVQVQQYCAYLEKTPAEDGNPLQEPHARDYAVRDYKIYLKTVRKRQPTTVNLALAAIDHFYSFLHMARAQVRREELPQQAPRALDADEQKRFLRALERCPSVRDRAVALLLFYTGLRVSECATLDLDDLLLSARKGKVIVRDGKGNTYREVPLNTEVREAQKAWLQERQRRFLSSQTPGPLPEPAGNPVVRPRYRSAPPQTG
jgi:integrase/recombinase XerC